MICGKSAVFVCLLGAVGAALVQAQSGTATITGSVTDPSGAAIHRAAVSARNPETGDVRSTITNETGNYNLPGLRPAAYDVTVESPGFRRYSQREFRVEVDQVARLDVQLELGQVAEQVEVRGTAQLLHTENATVGSVIETRKIVELPLNGRNFVQLSLLVPGVNTGQPGAGRGGGVSIGGARSEQNAFQLDGVSNTDQYDSGIAFRPNVDVIQEFKIEVNNYSAEFGKGAGGQINVVTKSGTNQFHGSAWEFHRNNAVQARNFFDNNPAFVTSGGRFKAPPFIQNQFGALASGPVIRNKTFFLGSYEGFRRVRGATGRRSVPTAAMRQGDFSAQLGAPVGTDALGRAVFANQIFDARTSRMVPGSNRYVRDPFPGNRIFADRIDPIAAKLLQMGLWPLPNVAGTRDARTGDPRQNYLDGRPNRNLTNQYLARVDHRFTDNDTLYGRFGYNESDDKGPGNFPGNERISTNTQAVIAASYTKAISATKVNELRFGWTRESPFSGATRIQQGRNLVRELGIRGLPLAGPGAPSVGIAGLTSFSDP
ncbi:MAG TPA: carboxypeptidase-like regulatory domain-containing protein, partial [Bryobacteraceae bacterium]|nr:carboxypeptidase-like regulatory domain-containing protein [Bryobacteraceae bacterium]